MTKEEFKMKLDDIKRGAADKARSVGRWVTENPLVTVAFASIGMKAASGIYGAIRQERKDRLQEEKVRAEIELKREESLRDWDPRTGHYVPRTRALTGRELAYVDEQRKKDRDLTDIYRELGVLRL